MVKHERLLNITKAAELLGVHPLTLRNWADKGYIGFFRTPGGHRRFRLEDLNAFLAQMNQGTQETTLITAARQAVKQAIATLPRQSAILNTNSRLSISDQQRAMMRDIGRTLLGLVIQYVAGSDDEAVLQRGREIGYAYGRFACQQGLSISETVETFNFFRDTIIDVTFDTSTGTMKIDSSNPQLYRRLNHFLNGVLLATVQAVEEGQSSITG
jgi:excisionase family DNA binding protein